MRSRSFCLVYFTWHNVPQVLACHVIQTHTDTHRHTQSVHTGVTHPSPPHLSPAAWLVRLRLPPQAHTSTLGPGPSSAPARLCLPASRSWGAFPPLSCFGPEALQPLVHTHELRPLIISETLLSAATKRTRLVSVPFSCI